MVATDRGTGDGGVDKLAKKNCCIMVAIVGSCRRFVSFVCVFVLCDAFVVERLHWNSSRSQFPVAFCKIAATASANVPPAPASAPAPRLYAVATADKNDELPAQNLTASEL